jgi:membrane fusion protein, multidrug efflux system
MSTGRRRVVVASVLCVAAAGAVTAAALGIGGSRTPQHAAADLPPERAQVTRETIVDTDEVTGDLGYGATEAAVGRIPGVITKMPLPGDVFRRGQAVYRVDNTPIVLMYGDVAAYRTLGPGTTGVDVRQLEENLKALGYTGFTVDTSFTATTATAVRNWQKALGLPQTGRVEEGRVLFAPGAIRVDSVATGVNQSTGGGAGGGGEVLQYTGTGRVVTARLEVAKQRLARKGVAVQIVMPDSKRVPGRVERVYTVIDPAADSGGEPTTSIEAVISLNDPQAANGIEAASVNVVFTASQRENVLTVPVAALVALAEGGYGLEVIDGSTTHYIKVQTGLFANGRVEVTGDGLAEGETVGMPR